ncbi:hypothetical protein ABGB06_08915 [Streptomyces sp. B6B3]
MTQHDLPGLALDNLRVSGCGAGRCATAKAGRNRNGPCHHEIAAAARADLAVFPAALATSARAGLTDARDAYAPDLRAAARADNGWLFHSLLTPLPRTAYIAWFAAEGRYCPFPKHLPAWAERHTLAHALVDRILALPTAW